MGHEPDQVEANGLSLQDRLEAAMASKGVKATRGLAVLLAGGTGDKAQVERWRKSVQRMLKRPPKKVQTTVQLSTAMRLSEVLDVPVDYWPTARDQPKNPVALAETLLRQLDAGAPVPLDAVEAVAVSLEQTAAIYETLAGRLRASAATGDSGP